MDIQGRCHCGHVTYGCGSPLCTHAVDDPRTHGLRVGGIDQRRALAPRKQIGCRAALPRTQDPTGSARRDGE